MQHLRGSYGYNNTVIDVMQMMADAKNKSFRGTMLHMWQDGGLRGLFKGKHCSLLARTLPRHRCIMPGSSRS